MTYEQKHARRQRERAAKKQAAHDLFLASALQGLLTADGYWAHCPEAAAATARKLADALMEQRQ